MIEKKAHLITVNLLKWDCDLSTKAGQKVKRKEP